MKCYTPQFEVGWPSPCPSKAHPFSSLKEAMATYEEFVADAANFGQTPLSAPVYLGEPDGDEEQLGYPDYPDYILKTGKRGAVLLEKA